MTVPAAGVAPMTCRARVIVRKLQLGRFAAFVLPLPFVAVESSPFTGSTKYWLPVAAAHFEQTWLTSQKYVAPNIEFVWQSLSSQQLPVTHFRLQQVSPAFAAHVPRALHVDETHLPLLASPVVVLQIVAAP